MAPGETFHTLICLKWDGEASDQTLWGSSQCWLHMPPSGEHLAHVQRQPGEQEADFCKQNWENILKQILMYYTFEGNTKTIHLRPLTQVIIHMLLGGQPSATYGELLCIPLRSTRWYICMFICLIWLLQMSYRHIKGLTLTQNDIRASGGRLMGIWSNQFKSYIERFALLFSIYSKTLQDVMWGGFNLSF